MVVGTLDRAVSRGVTLLDSLAVEGRCAPNWRSLIDRQTLDMASPYLCVFGQLVGHYNDAVVKFDLSFEEAELLGFNVWHPLMYRALTATWISYLDHYEAA